MKLPPLGTSISPVEVTHLDGHGLWVWVREREYFLSHEDFPWFRKARLDDVLKVELHHGTHLLWPALDVDLTVDSLEHPGRYPLVAEG